MAAITADFLTWTEAVSLIHKLERDENHKMCLLVAFGCFWGLRAGEILALRWRDILGKDSFEVEIEKSGNKSRRRKIDIISDIRDLIARVYSKMQVKKLSDYIFLNRKTGKPYTTQNMNGVLKTLAKRYRLSAGRFSTHSLRKTFGRHYWEENNHSEQALIILSEVFRHQKISDTKRYLGITGDEIKSVYHSFRL
jgi:integrase